MAVLMNSLLYCDQVHVFFVDPPHRVGVLCMGVILHSDTAKQRFAIGSSVGLVGRHNSHFRNSNAT